MGLVLIFPGIEGPSVWNRNLARGLDEGGVTSAIEIYDWSTGIPGDFLGNLTDLERNRVQAKRASNHIIQYQRRHPRRPICLVGHSGGGGIAVLALEQSRPNTCVDLTILLAPALSPGYDLQTALRRSRRGIVNFYSERDVSMLKVGTSVFGPIDRDFGVSAGAAGFNPPEKQDETARRLYSDGLRQVRWSTHLKKYGVDGSHVGWTSRQFAREYLAPLIQEINAAHPAPAAAGLDDRRHESNREECHVDNSAHIGLKGP